MLGVALAHGTENSFVFGEVRGDKTLKKYRNQKKMLHDGMSKPPKTSAN